MSEQSRKQVDLIPGLRFCRNVIHLALRLQFPKHTLLGTTTVVIIDKSRGTQFLVRHDDFEFITVLVRLEEIELHGSFLLLLGARADHQETTTTGPRLGLPLCLEVR